MPEEFTLEDFQPKDKEEFTLADFKPKEEEFSLSDFQQKPKPVKRPVPTLTLGERLSGPLYFAADVAEKTAQGILHPFKSLESGAEAAATLAMGSPKQLLVRPTEVAETPIGPNIPSIPQQKGLVPQVAAGVGNAVIDFANQLKTPAGIAMLGIGKLPNAIKDQTLKLLASQMAAGAPQSLLAATDAARKGDWQEAAKHVAEAGGGAFLSGQIAKHGGPRPILEPGAPGAIGVTHTEKYVPPEPPPGPIGLGVEGFPVQEAMPSGLGMAPRVAPPTPVEGGIKATPEMLELLDRKSVV